MPLWDTKETSVVGRIVSDRWAHPGCDFVSVCPSIARFSFGGGKKAAWARKRVQQELAGSYTVCKQRAALTGSEGERPD